ncbi:MFS transporter [Amycolatopsis sp. QT-25]|uniref:MFS transporter n=1 Tax=Amycolatopsis sp. QT-25 TaxID=3034022 RepID=UPI0023EBD586|nr:MFS transporter [Amycolatopsis sp. QT-25]WET77463.1 MFS transporter [Amycolatopsis sp. QT-25]
MTMTLDTPSGVTSEDTLSDKPYRWRWPALFVIMTGSVMELLDMTVTSIAGPVMRASLGGGTAMIQWLGVAYTLAMVSGLLTGGRLGDIFGRKRMFLIGAAGFVAGSLLCAIAVSPETIIAARVVQGLFGAAMIPQGLGMMKEMFTGKELQSAFGMFGPVMGLAAVGGPILAGWLVDADLFGTGWRMIFLINLPIGALAVLAAVKFLPAGRPGASLKLDIPGALLATTGALLIVFPLVQGREYGWPLWTFAMMAAAVVVFGVFAWFEKRKSGRGGDPLVEPGLFRKRSFLAGMATGTIYFAAFSGFGLVFTLYLQLGLGFSPLEAGLTGVPMSLGMIVGMGLVQVVRKHGRKVLHTGALIMAAGVVALLLLLGPETGPWLLAPALLVVGIGSGLIMGPYFEIALSGVEPSEAGSASGALTSLQQVGGALGMALLGTVFFDAGTADPTDAAQRTFWVVAVMVMLTFAVGFLLPERIRDVESAG